MIDAKEAQSAGARFRSSNRACVAEKDDVVVVVDWNSHNTVQHKVGIGRTLCR